jgi:hypothetical protein
MNTSCALPILLLSTPFPSTSNIHPPLQSASFNQQMGQFFDKPPLPSSVSPFISLSPAQIRALWQSFSLNSDGWGVSSSLFAAICECVGASKESSDALFKLLDTDKNDIIDGLEAFATLVS